MREAGTDTWDGVFQSWRPRLARKEHRCDGGCGRPIRPGEQYLEIRLCELKVWTVRLCDGCELEHDRQATEWGEAAYEVYYSAQESGRTFNPVTVRWEVTP